MKNSPILAVVFLTAGLLFAHASVANDLQIAYSEKVILLGVSEEARKTLQSQNSNSVTARAASVQFDAFGRRFDLQLSPNTRLFDESVREHLADAVIAYKGSINGAPDSWLRLVFADGVPSGMLWDGTEMYAIDRSLDGTEAIIYKLSDMTFAPGSMTCAAEASSTKTAAELLAKIESESGGLPISQTPDASLEIDVGIVADFEFFQSLGGDSQSAMISRMNIVDGIFSEQLGVQMTVAQIEVFNTASDPFSDETGASALIEEVRDYRTSGNGRSDTGLTHLFTGRDLDGSTVGIAYLGATCSRQFGVGLTQATGSTTRDALIAAHEFGHNFDAPHDGEGACASTAQDFLMAPRLNGVDQFSDCSLVQMQSEVNGASCLSPLAATDVGVSQGIAPATALLGTSVEITFSVDNVGTEDVASANIAIDIPNQLSLTSITSSSGSCSSGAATASCDLNAISSGSGATVTLNALASAVGSAELVASITVTDDSNFVNDRATSTVVVDPAVDLTVTTSGGNVTIDQSRSISATIRNDATITANAVVATVDVASGLQVDSATLANGNCTVSSGSQVNCDLSSLAPQATATISMQVTGVSIGGQSFTASVGADETDIDTANNEATGNVTVTDVTPVATGGGDSGGGALGLLGLLLLFGFAGLSRARN